MLRTFTALAIVLLYASTAFALGEESVGNEKMSGANYKDWPGALAVINDEHRVYRTWINGNEQFYFAGDTKALNAALVEFAKIKADRRVVVLRPVPATTNNFAGDHVFEYSWRLHLLGGIAKHMATRDLGDNIWDPNPHLHVHIGGDIQLMHLEIPKDVEVLEIADLQKRYAKSFGSTDQSVRGWACGELAQLNVYDEKSMKQIAKQLQDGESWVQLNAAGALRLFTHQADEAVAKLKTVVSEDEQLNKRIAETIETLESAKPDDKAKAAFLKSLKSIHGFVTKHRERQ